MSAETDTFNTTAQASEGIYKDKGSKFLAFAIPLCHENDLKPVIDALKKEHFKAVHFCFAYRLGVDGSIFRTNDDGEPSGSAGKPILNTLISRNLTNIAVIVVRYWGGTLLGVSGLINAYKSASEEALNNAIVIEKTVDLVYQLRFEYLAMNDVMKIIKQFDIKILSQVFDNECVMKVSFRKSLEKQILEKLNPDDKIVSYSEQVLAKVGK